MMMTSCSSDYDDYTFYEMERIIDWIYQDLLAWLNSLQKLFRVVFDKPTIPMEYRESHKFSRFRRRACSGYRSQA